MSLVQALTYDDLGIMVKFDKFVKVSSLVNSAFILVDSHSNSITFDPISTIDDYNSISRTLQLTFANHTLPAETYTFTISGLVDAANVVIDDYSVTFTAGDATPFIITEPLPDPIIIADQSIRSQAFMTSETIFVSNPDFYVVSTDPDNLELYLPPDYNSGRVTIQFSARPDSSTLNPGYFKAQRKFIQRLPIRWETLPVQISLDTEEPLVYVDFPSDDATPVFTTPGHTYFVEGYKYRIILSKNIGI